MSADKQEGLSRKEPHIMEINEQQKVVNIYIFGVSDSFTY